MAKNGITWFDLFDTPEKRMIFAKSAADQMMVQMKEENITIHTWCKAKKEEFTNEDILFQYFDVILEGLSVYANLYSTRISRDEENLFLPDDGLQKEICESIKNDIQDKKEALSDIEYYMNYLEQIKIEREDKNKGTR